MSDVVTMCLMGVFVIIGLMLLSRLMGSGFGGTNFTQRGDETSHYDDPDIDSHGSFGGRRSSGSGSSGSNAPRHDSPNIRSRGSFGRSRR